MYMIQFICQNCSTLSNNENKALIFDSLWNQLFQNKKFLGLFSRSIILKLSADGEFLFMVYFLRIKWVLIMNCAIRCALRSIVQNHTITFYQMAWLHKCMSCKTAGIMAVYLNSLTDISYGRFSSFSGRL